jgi:hypothetical protein
LGSSKIELRFSTRDSTRRGEVVAAVLQSRVAQGGVSAAVGYDSVFKLSSTGEVIVCSVSLGALVQVPALTRGYVGKTFWTPVHATYRQLGRTAALVIVPLELGKVTVYKREDVSVVAEREFTDLDVARKNHWFRALRFEAEPGGRVLHTLHRDRLPARGPDGDYQRKD